MRGRPTADEKAWAGYSGWDKRWSKASIERLKEREARDLQEDTYGWYDDGKSMTTARQDEATTLEASRDRTKKLSSED